MFVIMKVTRNDADLITYHLPVTSQKEGPPVVFVGCYLCGYQALNSVLPLPLIDNNGLEDGISEWSILI
ncbi:MAG: hypothetical protein BWX93_01525 [Bacteroidetes bacterium ADurb.Bin139]|nr:MAG: hypothetical protein BWX93_01525 [Bacteroidetes bacterium ADurb.Bin139]